MNIKRGILISGLSLMLAVSLTACNGEDSVKNPYGKINEEELGEIKPGKVSESNKFEMTNVSDPFIRKFISELIKDDKVLDYEELDFSSDDVLNEYGQDMIFKISLEKSGDVEIYRMRNGSQELKSMRGTGRLNPIIKTSIERNVYVRDNYGLIREGVSQIVVDAFLKKYN